jgi:MYXO-CTERM domain-containing protein
VNTLHSNRRKNRLSRCKLVVLGAATAAASLLGASAARPALAANVLLQNGNSTVTIDPTSTAGVEDWTINGQNQLNQEWFWFRPGSQKGQSSLNSLGTPTVTPLDMTGDGKDDMVEMVYGSSSSLQITVTYSLVGGLSTSKTSDLDDLIQIDNNSSKSMKFSFFQYANFNLGDSTTGQTVTITDSSATATVDGNGYQAQTVSSPTPTEFEANIYPNLLNQISSGSTSATLSGATSVLASDGEWGYEWTMTLPSCGSYVISGDQLITGQTLNVPEPVSGPVALLGLGGLFMTRPRRRDEDADHRTVVHVAEA